MQVSSIPLAIKTFRDDSTSGKPYVAHNSDFKVTAAAKSASLAKKKLVGIIAGILAQEVEENNLEHFLGEIGFGKKSDGTYVAPQLNIINLPLKNKKANL